MKGSISAKGSSIESEAVIAQVKGDVAKLGPFSLSLEASAFKATAREAFSSEGSSFGGEAKMIEFGADLTIGKISLGGALSIGAIGAQYNAEISQTKIDLSFAADLGIGLEVRGGYIK